MRLDSVLVAACALALTTTFGCSSDSKSVAADTPSKAEGTPKPEAKASVPAKSEVPADWTKLSVDGVSISIPKDWKGSALDEATMRANEELLGKGSDLDKELLTRFKTSAAAGNVKLVAFDLDPQSKSVNNFNITTIDMPSEMDAPAFAQAAAPGIESMVKAGTKPVVTSSTFPAGKVGIVSSVMEVPNATGAKSEMSSTMYIVTKGKKAYNFTFSCLVTDEKTKKALFEQMAKTISVD